MSSPKVFDLFSGVGGFSLGFAQAGFDVAMAIDNNETTVETYRRNFPTTNAVCYDLSEPLDDSIFADSKTNKQEVDVVVGGPPCQGFSVMGKQDPDDERNELLLMFAGHIEDLDPEYFVLENVPGLISATGEDYLQMFLDRIDSAGYEVIDPIKKLNAADYGVPQNRERVVVIGYRQGNPEPDYPDPRDITVGVWKALKDLPEDIEQLELEDGEYSGELGEPSEYVQEINSWTPTEIPNESSLTGLDPVNHNQEVRERFSKVEPGNIDEVSRFQRLAKDAPSNTLRAGSSPDRGTHTAARPIHPVEPRCITVREAARLQSFPDWFQFHKTKYHGMRQIGNSVPPLMARSIAEEVLSAFGKSGSTITHAR